MHAFIRCGKVQFWNESDAALSSLSSHSPLDPWEFQDEAIQCNASNAWMRKSLILPGSLLANLAPISPLCHSPPDPWEITLNPNFLRRPVCYSCLENPSLSST